MAKISATQGPTDEHAPGYLEPGRSHHSPNVRAVEEVKAEEEEPILPLRTTGRTVHVRKRGPK